jgi:hypothetical protein
MKSTVGIIFSREKKNPIKIEDNTAENEDNIFPYLYKDLHIINKYSDKNNNHENENKREYIVEKGIFISPICIASKNEKFYNPKKSKEKNDNEDLILPTNNIKNKKYHNSRNLKMNSLNIFNSNNNTISRKRSYKTYEDNKNNIYPTKIYTTNDIRSDSEKKNGKDKKMFTNENISSCIKDLFKTKFNKIKNENNTNSNSKYSSLTNYTNRKINNSRNDKNRNKIYSVLTQNEYNYNYNTISNKTMYSTNANKKKKKNNFNSSSRTKYVFKYNPFFKIEEFKDLPEKIKILNQNNLNSIKKDTNKYFGQSFCLIKKENFSSKYRNPLLNNNLLDEDKDKIEKYKKINENIIPGMNIIKELDCQRSDLENLYKPKKKINKKRLLSKIKSTIIRNSNYIKHLSISALELLDINKNNQRKDKDIMEFEIEEIKTTELIKAIKAESITLVDELIKKNKEIISNCDVFQFTPLHWAAKKGFYLAIPKLISYGAQVNAQNFLGETPLHISVKRNNYECTVLLLIFLASPFIKDNKGRNPFEYSDDYQMKILYEKITKLYYNNAFTKNSLFYEKIQSQFIWFIKNEFSNQIKKEALIIVDGIEREMKIGIELEMKMKSIEKKYIPI